MSQNSNKKIRGKIIACLDIGSSKLMCLIATINNDKIEVIGYSHKEARGILCGAISDMKLAQKSIINVVSEAERMAGINIEQLLVSLSGNLVTSSRKEESTKISSEMVKSLDINNLATKIRTAFRKNNREMIHLIPLQYRIDDSAIVQNPRHMYGEKLYAKFHAISTSQTTIKNIENCLKKCQLSVNNYIVEPYASSLSCLSDNEMSLGTLLVDIGADITSFSLTMDSKMVYVGSVNIGGNHITRDIATILNINFSAAEKIKNLNNSLIIPISDEEEIIKFKTSENETPIIIKITRSELRDIIKSRIEEMFESIKQTLEKAGVPEVLISNIVLTGGTSLIIGIDKLASEIFNKQSRIGYPTQAELIGFDMPFPNYSCAIGMLVFLKNLYLKEKIKDGFEIKNSWIRRFIDKLVAI